MLIVLIILFVLLLGVGPYRWGGPQYGPYYGAGGLGFALIVLLILYALGAFGPVRPLRL